MIFGGSRTDTETLASVARGAGGYWCRGRCRGSVTGFPSRLVAAGSEAGVWEAVMWWPPGNGMLVGVGCGLLVGRLVVRLAEAGLRRVPVF